MYAQAGRPPLLNITVVSYVPYPAVFLSSRPFTGPALDMGVQRLRDLYNFNVSHKYIGSCSWWTIDDMLANTDYVSKYVYQEYGWQPKRPNEVLAFIGSGSFEQAVIGQLARGRERTSVRELPSRLPIRLPACLPICLPVCLSVCLFVCLSV